MNQKTFANLEGELKSFYENHGVQLLGCEFTPSLLEELYRKLTKQVFDAGEYLEIIDDQSQDSFVVQTRKPLKALEHVFLIDHMLSFRYQELNSAIKEEIVPRLEEMLQYQYKKKPIGKQDPVSYPRTQEMDSLGMKSLKDCQIWADTEALSAMDNQITDVQEIIEVLKQTKVKAIWLDDNPLIYQELVHEIEQQCPQIELLNSKFTRNAGAWAFKYVTLNFDCVKAHGPSDQLFLNLRDRDVLKCNPEVLDQFANLISIDLRETDIKDYQDGNQLFKFITRLESLFCDPDVEDMLYELYQGGKLQEIAPKLKLVNERDIRNKTTDLIRRSQKIKEALFKITGCYRLLSTDQMDESAVWYVMDELGTHIQHSDTPNVKVVPFLYLPNGKIDDQTISYSLLYPTRDISEKVPLFRDYLNGIDEAKFRSYRLSVWFNIPTQFLIDGYKEYSNNLEAIKLKQQPQEQIPIEYLPMKDIKIITDLEMITNNVTLPYTSFTNQVEEADLIYFGSGIHDDINQYVNKFMNQYQHEYAIISKEKLAFTIQKECGHVPWLQETFNLQTQLPLFLGAFKQRKQLHQENTWIIKPPNMARSMDMVVTNNVDIIVRLLETGPKLAQKYIDRPLFLRGKKFDLRFIVALKSIAPLQVYIYRTFWIRTSNNPYTMDVNSFTTYETHFTVMNYGRQLTQIFMHEFIEEFNKDYSWDIQFEAIKEMVRGLFQALKSHKPEMAECRRSRAIYGMDVMIDENHQPKLLEMTFSPDCNRACKYTPSFFNDIFECLFFGQENQNMIPLF